MIPRAAIARTSPHDLKNPARLPHLDAPVS
jgi:hypothetical protein